MEESVGIKEQKKKTKPLKTQTMRMKQVVNDKAAS